MLAGLVALSAALLSAPAALARGACTPEWTDEFLAGNLGGAGLAFCVYDDGNGAALYVGGSWTNAGNVAIPGLARWDATGFQAVGTGGPGGGIRALTVWDPDGAGPQPALLVAGGDFSGVLDGVATWNGTTWAPLGAFNGAVRALAVADFGSGPKLYAGGSFTQTQGAGGSLNNRFLAVWDGADWQQVGTVQIQGDVHALAVFNDGGGMALFAGGSFVPNAFQTMSGVGRWDGSAWSDMGGGVTSGDVRSLAVFNSGSGSKLYVGGLFTSAGGSAASRIASWDGTWHALGAGVAGGGVTEVSALLAGQGVLHVGGTFQTAGGLTTPNAAKWSSAGWAAVSGGVNGAVRAFGRTGSGGDTVIYAAGDFTAPGSRFAVLNGNAWESTSHDANERSLVMATVTTTDGTHAYAGGQFTLLDGGRVAATRIARWDGAAWSALGSGLNNDPAALSGHTDGALYAGGLFVSAGGNQALRVAKYSGGAWSQVGAGFTSGQVNALASYGGALYACGNFTMSGTMAVNSIAVFDGAAWQPVLGGLNAAARCMIVFDDGMGPKLYVGGGFSMANGAPANNVARWDGSAWSALSGSGVNVGPRCFAVFDDGSGAALFTAGLTSSGFQRVRKYTATGWVNFGGDFNDNGVDALLVHDDGTGDALYASGAFSMNNGVPVSCLAKWSGTAWVAVDGSLSGGVGNATRGYCMTSFTDASGPSLLVGGIFGRAGQTSSGNLARFGCPTPAADSCRADANGDGAVNFADLNLVLSQFSLSGPGLIGDVNGDDNVNFADLNIVLSAFGVTC